MKTIKFVSTLIVAFTLGNCVSFAQSTASPIEVKLQFINILMERYDSVCQDSVPVVISFNFHVINHTDKEVILGYALSTDEHGRRRAVGGRMFLKNGKMSFELRGGHRETFFHIFPKDTVEIWGELDWRNDILEAHKAASFSLLSLQKYLQMDGNADYKECFYEFFRGCTWAYVPIVEDYEEYIPMAKKSRSSIKDVIYPTQPIAVSFYNPWFVNIFQMSYSGETIRPWRYGDGCIIFPDNIKVYHVDEKY